MKKIYQALGKSDSPEIQDDANFIYGKSDAPEIQDDANIVYKVE